MKIPWLRAKAARLAITGIEEAEADLWRVELTIVDMRRAYTILHIFQPIMASISTIVGLEYHDAITSNIYRQISSNIYLSYYQL